MSNNKSRKFDEISESRSLDFENLDSEISDSEKFGIFTIIGQNTPPLTYKISQSRTTNPIKIGDIFELQIRNKAVLGVLLDFCAKPEFECKTAQKSKYQLLPQQKILANFIKEYYCCTSALAYDIFTLADSEISQTSESHAPDSQISEFNAPNFKDFQNLNTLSDSQNSALQFIQNALDSQNSALLFGDTGSGKTEIYMHLIAQALAQGKSTLFLMPEISLTPQMQARLKKVFGEKVAIWHSKITPKKKSQILKNLQNGSVKIIAGARSALFLPFQNLGLIIVDEEHDDAYKSSATPKYNARDLALFLAKKCGIKTLLGSATPSLNSYRICTQNRTLYRLKGTHFDSAKKYEFQSEIFTQTLFDKMASTLKNKKQIMVFIPTRAHFKTLCCQACGEKIKCAFCSVNLSAHFKKNALVCHYCGYSEPIPQVCPRCKSENLMGRRIGTQEFATQISQIFPSAKIGIFDRDHITTQKKLESVLSDFGAQKIDILVGTQMIAKGHDYHSVGLCVICDIDFGLELPDFRASEKSVALLTQIAGRVGRKGAGEILVHSIRVQFLEQFLDDYEDFLCYELENRPQIYPPFVRFANLTFSHKNAQTACEQMLKVRDILQRQIDKISESKNSRLDSENAKSSQLSESECVKNCAPNNTAHFLQNQLSESANAKNGASNNATHFLQNMQSLESKRVKNEIFLEIMGAKECEIPKINNLYRFNILLRSNSARALIAAITHAANCAHFAFEIDIDPLSIT